MQDVRSESSDRGGEVDHAAEGTSGARTRAFAFSGTGARRGHLLIGAAATGAIFIYLQFSTAAILDVDGYYHVRWSQLLWEGMRRGVFPPAFPWLPLTTLNPQDYVDHHLLFHILLIPFTWFGDIRAGAKVAAALFGALAVFSCYWLIVRYRIKYTLVWLVALLACSAPFLYRLSMTRAQSVSIVFMVTGIYLLFEKRYRWLAPLAFLYVWTYSLFVMLGAAALIWAGVIWWSERRLEWRPVLWTCAGTLAGFILNPYVPKNIFLFLDHLSMKLSPAEFSTSVGAEWYPYESWYFFGSCLVAFTAMAVGYIAFDWADRRASARALFFLIFSTLLLIINARSRRFVEYWPAFAVLFAAFSLQPILNGLRDGIGRLPSDVLDELQPFLDRHERPEIVKERERSAAWGAAMIAIALAIPLYFNVRATAKTIAADASPAAYRGGINWIRANVPRGEMIFNTDWDDFPMLFFYDTDHLYTSGLDPTYQLHENPELSELYKRITLGDEENPGPIIRNRFGARYVFTDNEHDAFYGQALDSGWFEEVYADQNCTVLRIRDARDKPPPVPSEEQDEGDDPTATGESSGDDAGGTDQ